MPKVLRRLASLLLIALGLFLLYAAGWVTTEAIWPQVQTSGWSLSDTSMILNREWVGNEIHLLVLGYIVMGAGLVTGGSHLWRGPRKA